MGQNSRADWVESILEMPKTKITLYNRKEPERIANELRIRVRTESIWVAIIRSKVLIEKLRLRRSSTDEWSQDAGVETIHCDYGNY